MIGTEIASLFATIGGNTEPLEKSLGKTSGLLGSLGSTLGGTVSKAIGIGVAGIVGAGAAIVGGLGAAVASTNVWAEQLDHLGDVLGTKADDSAAFAVAIRGVGGNVDGLTGQFAKLAAGMFDSKGELSTSGLELQKLGIAFRDANGQMLPSTDILLNIANRLGPMADGFQKTEAMTAIFGKSGKDLSDTMTALAGNGFENAKKKAQALGLTLGEDGVNRSVMMGRAMNDLQMTMQGLAVSVGSELLPAILPLIQEFSGWAISVMPQVRTALSSVVQGVKDLILGITTGKGPAGEFGTFVRGVFEGIVTTVGNLITWFGANWPRIKDFAITTFGPIVDEIGRVINWVVANWPWVEYHVSKAFADIKVFWDNVGAPAFGEVLRIFRSVVAWAQENWPKVQEAFGKVVAWIKENWPKVEEAFGKVKDAVSQVVAWVVENWPKVQKTFEDVVAAVKKAYETYIKPTLDQWEISFGKIRDFINENSTTIKNIIDGLFRTIQGIVKTVVAIFKGDWEGAWNGMKDTLDGVTKTMSNTLTLAFNTVKRIVEETVASIKEKWEKSWEFLTGLMGKIWSTITTAWGSILTSINEKLTKIGEDIDTAWRNFRNTITGWAASLWAAAKRIWDQLWSDGPEGMPARFMDLGRRLIEGLRDGIRNAAEQVFGAVRWLVEGVVTVAQHNFGIQSPSKVFATMGRQLMAGLAGGISDAASMPQRALDAATNGLSVPALGAGAASGAGGSGSGGAAGRTANYTLNVTTTSPAENLFADFALLRALGG
jgi:phage-related protein